MTDTPTPTPTLTPGLPEAFRIDSISLRDPHLFAFLGTCMDGTDPPGVLGIFSANGELSTLLNNDGDGDGFLDLNLLAVFRSLHQPPFAGGNLDIATGECTPPVGGETCGPDANPPQVAAYTNQTSGLCSVPLPGTSGPNNTGSYTPGIGTPGAPCFSTTPVNITFPFGLFTLPLQDVRAGATYVGSPANQLADGLLSGFLSESDANSILLPMTIPIIGASRGSLPQAAPEENCPWTRPRTSVLGQLALYLFNHRP
jgi:hypothetical protein